MLIQVPIEKSAGKTIKAIDNMMGETYIVYADGTFSAIADVYLSLDPKRTHHRLLL